MAPEYSLRTPVANGRTNRSLQESVDVASRETAVDERAGEPALDPSAGPLREDTEGEPLDDPGTGLTGRVVDALGASVGGAEVWDSALRETPIPWPWARRAPVATLSDPNGALAVNADPTESLEARASGHAPSASKGASGESTSSRLLRNKERLMSEPAVRTVLVLLVLLASCASTQQESRGFQVSVLESRSRAKSAAYRPRIEKTSFLARQTSTASPRGSGALQWTRLGVTRAKRASIVAPLPLDPGDNPGTPGPGARDVRPGQTQSAPSAANTDEVHEQSSPADEAHEAADPQEFHHHTIFLTTAVVNDVRGGGGPAYGIEYEYQPIEEFGVAVFGEFVAGKLQVGVFGALAYWHPTERLALGIGPGVETDSEHTEGLIRIGGFYEFKAEEVVIAPTLYFDLLEGGELVVVFGVNFGKKF